MSPKVLDTISTDLPNSQISIRERVAEGRITWVGPLTLVTARTFLLVISQGLVALVFVALHHPTPWREAGDWWVVYGTLVDIGCLIGLRYFTRQEGIRMRDLLGPIRLRYGRDLFVGLGYFLLVFPFFLGGGYFAGLLLYGTNRESLNQHLIHLHALPIWAVVYSVTLWWLIWSPTEEATYQGYALPRFEGLAKSKLVGLVIVGFWWTLQHCALPFVPEWRFVAFRFLSFLPGVIVMMLIYLRTRRLAPLIVAHWPMDITAAIMTAIY